MITSWNKGAERLFGYTSAEAVGQSITSLLPSDPLDEEARILTSLRRGEPIEDFETVRVRKDGLRVNVSLSVSPIKDIQGRIVGASRVARDITQSIRQEAALKRANADLQQFAYSASHDLQEPLRTLTVYSQLLQRDFGDKLGDRGGEFIRYIISASTRMHDLLRDLRIYTQVSMTDHEPVEEVDAGEMVEKALQNLEVAVRESGALVSFAGLPRIRMRAFELEQVFHSETRFAIAAVPGRVYRSRRP